MFIKAKTFERLKLEFSFLTSSRVPDKKYSVESESAEYLQTKTAQVYHFAPSDAAADIIL